MLKSQGKMVFMQKSYAYLSNFLNVSFMHLNKN